MLRLVRTWCACLSAIFRDRVANEEWHCYLCFSLSGERPNAPCATFVRPRALKLQFAWNFANGRLTTSREREGERKRECDIYLKIKYLYTNHKFRNLRELMQKRVTANCVVSGVSLNSSQIIDLFTFILQPSVRFVQTCNVSRTLCIVILNVQKASIKP